MAQETESTLGLYVSVPFCRAKCSFCNFASGVGSAEAVERYVGLLCAEVRGARTWAREVGAKVPERVDTVYFGGGTPSLLEPTQLRAILAAIRGEFLVEAGAEITMEAAPGQVGDALLAAALDLGVNRVSLGVQSFVDREAQAVGRTHTEASCVKEFARLRAAGIRSLAVDLIAGLPYQTLESWERSLRTAASAELDHLSVYMLEIDEESRLGREVLGGGARLHAPAVASEDLVVTLYERACELLPRAGLTQYEISNFACAGHQSRHNLKYWLRAPYLGLGLDAHSMLSGVGQQVVRFANGDEQERYVGPGSASEPHWVNQRMAFEETVFLGLRLVGGLAWESMAEYPRGWIRELRDRVAGLCGEALMGMDAERLWLEPRGRMVSGEIFGELLAGVAA